MQKRNDDRTLQRGKETCHLCRANRIGVGSLHESDSFHSGPQSLREQAAKCERYHSADAMPKQNRRSVARQSQNRLQIPGEVLHAVVPVSWSRGPAKPRQNPKQKAENRLLPPSLGSPIPYYSLPNRV